MKKLLLSILFMVLTTQFASAQMPVIDLPLNITDGAGGMQELRFGLDAAATDGIDAALGESELPPIPPTGVFDARFIGTDIGISLGQGIHNDYRTGNASFSGMKTHEIGYQVGTGTAITISWDLPEGVTGVIQDLITGTLVNQAMTGMGNFTVPFPPTVISKLKMTITYIPVQQPPAAPTLASPADGAAGVSTSPTLSWNQVSEATSYQLQVSTDPNFSTTVVDQSGITATSSQVSGLLNNTQYHWRVRASNAGGMSDWSAVRSFTTIVAVPSAPTLASPADGATGLSTGPALSWNPVGGATSYQLQVSTDPRFSTTVVDQSEITATSSQASGLLNNTQYHWRVRASNAGGMSDWSAVRSFTTIVAVPSAPTLASPADGATEVSVSPTLSWNPVSEATSYQLQVSTDPNFSTTVVDQSGITATSSQVSGLLNNTQYYWRVRASNTGGMSDWSAARSFTTIVAVPSAPTLASPADGATDVSTSPTLSWNSVSGATSYQLQVSTDPNFSTTVVDQSGITAASSQVSGLLNNTQYYWRVRASNTGGMSDWSAVRSFTTIVAVPSAPTLASPADGATEVSVSPTLSWNPVSEAASYQLQVSTDPNFSTTVVDQSEITATSSQVGGLLITTKYYWRVNATNAGGMSDWSPVWSFTTGMTTAVEQTNEATPTAYYLNQNYPNPFNPSTRIRFALPEAGEVRLAIYNLSGQLVKQLVAGEMKAGYYSLVWDATDARGALVASGVYLYQLQAGSFTQVRKMSLLR